MARTAEIRRQLEKEIGRSLATGLLGDLEAAESRCKELEEAQLDAETLRIIEVALTEWGEANCSEPDFTRCGDGFCREFSAALIAVVKARTALKETDRRQRPDLGRPLQAGPGDRRAKGDK